MKKYEFTGRVKEVFGRTLHQIRATVAFGDVAIGDVGGWIEKEENLSRYGNAWVCDNACVYGDARVYGNAWVCDNACVYGDARVYGNARVFGNAWIFSNAFVYGDAWIFGNARVFGQARVFGNAWVKNNRDWCGITCIGSRNGLTTFFRTADRKIMVACGCFEGTIDEFAAKVQQTHGDNEHGKAYRLAIELAKLRIDLKED